MLYEKIKQLLAFDCLSELPSELAEKVLSYLEVASVCAVAQCCRKWRDLTNRDTIWSVAQLIQFTVNPIQQNYALLGMYFVNRKAT